MKKNKTLIGLLALGVLSTSVMAGCDPVNSDTPSKVDDTTDQDAADDVKALINALTNESSESVVVAARSAYDALTAAQKALVDNLQKLVAQETRINNAKLVKEVVDAIAALTDESTEDQVDAVFAKYTNLDDSLKDEVTNLALLLAQKARIDAKVVVDPVIDAINALTNQSTKEQVKAAEAAYNALSESDKTYVSSSVVGKLNAQLARVLEADVNALKTFINGIVVEDLVSDATVIEVLQDMENLDLSDAVVNGLTGEQKEKLTLLKKTTDSYDYAGVNQAKSWREQHWEHDSYGLLTFGEPTLEPELNAKVRSFEVTYYDDGESLHKEFGITLVGDNNLKDIHKEAVFYLYNPDIDTNLRIDFAKGTDESFCDGGTVALKHGWNRLSVSLNDVSDKNVINLMVGILNNEGGVTETSGWKISSFVKYDDSVTGAIRTEYYRISKLLKAYLEKQEATERNEYRTICEEYAKLTADEKAKLPEGVATKIAADEVAFKTADANALNDLLGNIPAINDQTDLVAYAVNYLEDLIEYKAQYNAFDADQKALVTNANILDGLEALSSYKVLSDGSKKFTGWSDYSNPGPDSVTDTDSTYGTIQKVTLDNADQTQMLFPVLEGYKDYDVVYFTVYCPAGFMEIVAEAPYWPYSFGTLEVGWNTVCVPVEVFNVSYPADSIGLFLNGAGEWKFGKAIGFVNTKGAEELVNTISGLTYTAQAGEEEAVIAAREAYNALGFKSKTLVSNIDALATLEGKVDEHYANVVISAIDALTFTHTDEVTAAAEKAAIESARASYDALNDTRKNMVTNLSKLTGLESDVATYYKDQLVAALKSEISGLTELTSATAFDVALATYTKAGQIKENQYYTDETEQSEKDKVEGVISFFEGTYTKISDLTTGMVGSPTITSKTDDVYGGVKSISADNADVQALFGESNTGSLESYDFIYVLIKTEIDGGFNLWGREWGTSVQTFSNLVAETWNILKINTSSFNTGDGGSSTFNQLDFCLGDLTNNHEVLMTAAYGFVDTAAANSVKEQIGALTYTEHSGVEEAAIASARSAYNALGKGAKAAVTNYETLTSMESSVDAYYVGAVVAKIEALEFDAQGQTQETQKAAIEAARASYNALSDARKAMVTNLNKLEEMEVAVATYYKAERLAALSADIAALPEEITTSTAVIDVMKVKVMLANCQAHDLYSELEQSYKDKIAALKEDIEDIYTTLLDGTSALIGWAYGSVGNTTSDIDDEFGNIQKITFADAEEHSLSLPTSEQYEQFDEVYISVYCPSGSLKLVNGAFWPYAYGSVSEGWNVIKVPGNVFADNYPTHSLGFLFNGAGEWKFGMVLGYTNKDAAASVVTQISALTFKDKTIEEANAIVSARNAYNALGNGAKALVTNLDTLEALEAEVSAHTFETFIKITDTLLFEDGFVNSPLNDYAKFEETTNDTYYGQCKVLKIAGATTNSFDVIVNVTSGLKEYDYSQVKFAIFNPTDKSVPLHAYMSDSAWVELSNQDCGTLAPGWNEISLDAAKLEKASLKFISLRFDFTNGGKSDEWLISKFAGESLVGRVIYSDKAINSDLTNWVSFTETGIDITYGNYKVMNLSAYNGTIQIIVNSVSSINAAAVKNVTFAIYNPTDSDATLVTILSMNNWNGIASDCENTVLHPGWNEITFSSMVLSDPTVNQLNIKIDLGSSTLDGWKISEFVANKAELSLVDYQFGQPTLTDEDDLFCGNIYDLIQEQWFIDNPDPATMASAQKGILPAKLPEGKTELVFKIYNPTDSEVTFYLGGEGYTGKQIKLAANSWTTVVITAADIAANGGTTLYYYIGSSNATGWQVTDIFAR